LHKEQKNYSCLVRADYILNHSSINLIAEQFGTLETLYRTELTGLGRAPGTGRETAKPFDPTLWKQRTHLKELKVFKPIFSKIIELQKFIQQFASVNNTNIYFRIKVQISAFGYQKKDYRRMYLQVICYTQPNPADAVFISNLNHLKYCKNRT
jgi:hypothetical protein